MSNDAQPTRFRVVDPSGSEREPRRYSQSTSSRSDSQGTLPAECLSSLIASASPTLNSGQTEIILRKYDSEVPQLRAYSSLAATSGSDSRKDLRASMPPSLPDSKITSILDGKLLRGNSGYHLRMDIEELRRANFFKILREKYSDSPKEFEIATGYSANMVSQLRSSAKDFGERVARTIEKAAKWKIGTLDQHLTGSQPEAAPTESIEQWPSLVSANREHFERLPPKTQRELDEAFGRMISGAYTAEVLSTPQPKVHKKSRAKQEPRNKQRHGVNQ